MHHHLTEVDASEPLLGNEKRSWQSKAPQAGSEHSRNQPDDFPLPQWTLARPNAKSRIMPQTIAHRGYKAEHPENTLRAFQGAVEVGAHAIETDIHLSKDGVVVLSHDGDLKRCFGQKQKIIDCDWEYLSSLRTLREPHEPMPQLKDLLEYVAQPGLEHIWILLDIKIDNNADDVMRLIANTLDSVHPGQRSWRERVVLGIWVAKFLPLCPRYLPGYPISHIGFTTLYARQFLQVPNVSFNMLQKSLLGPFGARFMRDVRKAKRPLYVWTVNELNLMKWSIQKQVDGVITDDPKTFRKLCEEWEDDKEPLAKISWSQLLYLGSMYVMIAIFILPFRRKFPETVESFVPARESRTKASSAAGR